VVTTETRIVPNPANFDYTGVVHTISPPEFTISLSTNFMNDIFGSIPLGEFISDAQKFSISVTGLKPNTYHKFMFENEDQTSKCAQSRTSTTNTTGLLTDVNGTLNFDFYYDAGINEATTDLEQQNKLAASKAGVKVFTVQSYDGNSKSTGSIGVKYYTSLPFGYDQPIALNTSQTATQVATTDRPAASAIPAGFSSQSIYDAVENNNVRIFDWDNLNERLR
jgi:hypothetical protein